MKPRILVLIAAITAAAACGKTEPTKAPEGSISAVTVVLKGSSEPLPFDPRGGRITIVTQEIAKLVGHPIILELDTALSPELKSSLEETVLASFETIARELVLLQKEDPEMFAKAKSIERVVCKYDAVAKRSDGKIEHEGKVLAVKAPPDRFPLLERGILSDAVYFAHIGDLDARWGEADPTRMQSSEQAAYFSYMVSTRAGSGHLWIAARAKKLSTPGGESKWDDLRVEHVGRILKLASVVQRDSSKDGGNGLEKKVRAFLLDQAKFLGGFQAEPPSPGYERTNKEIVRRVVGEYEKWLNQSLPSFDDEERLTLAKAVLDRGSDGTVVFPQFDRFAFGLAIYDQWVKDGAKVATEQGTASAAGSSPRVEMYKNVLCPTKRRGEAETDIRYGCSSFFSLALKNDRERARLAETIAKRRDQRLLELAVLNADIREGSKAIDLVLALNDDALVKHGLNILFHDLHRRDDVKRSLEERATKWWRDTPSRRGFALLVMARNTEGMDRHYYDGHWTRFVSEYGGPIKRDVFASFLSEGVRAVEMTPKIWLALDKSPERDDLVAKNLPVLFGAPAPSSRSQISPTLTLLRTRFCEEKNAAGLEKVRSSIERWVKDHPDDAATMSNARADFTLTRCAKPREDSKD